MTTTCDIMLEAYQKITGNSLDDMNESPDIRKEFVDFLAHAYKLKDKS